MALAAEAAGPADETGYRNASAWESYRWYIVGSRVGGRGAGVAHRMAVVRASSSPREIGYVLGPIACRGHPSLCGDRRGRRPGTSWPGRGGRARAARNRRRNAVRQPGQAGDVTFLLAEYLAQDANKALEFYKSLLGYASASTDAKLGIEYFVLRRDRPLAGLLQIPAAASQVRPNWLPYILVDDPSALAAKVSGLGGRVLLEPSPDRRNGTLAVVADPTGGVVAMQKYPI